MNKDKLKKIISVICKYIIVLLVSFFIMPLSKLKLGENIVLLFIVFTCFFGKKDMYIILFSSLTYVFLLNSDYFMLYLVSHILIIIYMLVRKKRNAMCEALMFCIIQLIFLLKTNNVSYLNFLIIITFCIIYYLLFILFDKNYITRVDIIYFICCFAGLGASVIDFEVKVGYLVAVAITAYISQKLSKNEGLYAGLLYLIYFALTDNIYFSFVFPFIYIVFNKPKLCNVIILIAVMMILALYFKTYYFASVVIIIIYLLNSSVKKEMIGEVIENNDYEYLIKYFSKASHESKNKLKKDTFDIIIKILQSKMIDDEIRNNGKEKIDKIVKEINETMKITKYFGYIDKDYLVITLFTKENNKKTIENIIKKQIKNEVIVTYDKEGILTKVIIATKKKIEIDYAMQEHSLREVSGDSIFCGKRANENSYFIVSDGMGKGAIAGKESNNVVEVINILCKSSLTSFTVMQLTNLYKMINDSERFCTLDYLEINPFTKKGYLYKKGSATTYIFKSDKSIVKIENDELPLGKEESIRERKIAIENKDVIFLSSDGLFDNVINDKKIIEYIKTILDLNAENIARYVINYAVKQKMISKDDISLICIKIL